MFKNFLVVFLCAIISFSSFASSRVDSTLHSTTDERLNKIVELEKTLVAGKKELSILKKQFVDIKASSDYHKGAISFRNKAAIVTIASAATLVLASKLGEARIAKAQKSGILFSHPTDNEVGMTILALIGAPVGALFTAGSEIGVLLTKDEAAMAEKQLSELDQSLTAKSKELEAEVKQLCKADPRHEVCYFDLSTILLK